MNHKYSDEGILSVIISLGMDEMTASMNTSELQSKECRGIYENQIDTN